MAEKIIPPIANDTEMLVSVFSEIDTAMRELGGTDKDWQKLLIPEAKYIRRQIASLIIKIPEIFPVTIDYGKSLDEMIEACNFDKIISESWERLAISGEGLVERELVLIEFGCSKAFQGVIKSLDALNLESASFEDLLAFSACYPDFQRRFNIAAVGPPSSLHDIFGGDFISTWHFAPVLSCDKDERTLLAEGLKYWDESTLSNGEVYRTIKVYTRFLARRKVSSS